jgi:hypothetical protein
VTTRRSVVSASTAMLIILTHMQLAWIRDAAPQPCLWFVSTEALPGVYFMRHVGLSADRVSQNPLVQKLIFDLKRTQFGKRRPSFWDKSRWGNYHKPTATSLSWEPDFFGDDQQTWVIPFGYRFFSGVTPGDTHVLVLL